MCDLTEDSQKDGMLLSPMGTYPQVIKGLHKFLVYAFDFLLRMNKANVCEYILVQNSIKQM